MGVCVCVCVCVYVPVYNICVFICLRCPSISIRNIIPGPTPGIPKSEDAQSLNLLYKMA